VLKGVLIAESLRVGASLDDLNLVVRRIRRLQPRGATADQAPTWTLLDFEVDEPDAEALAQRLAAALAAPGWYADFHSPAESYVVFPDRVFRFRRGDAAGRAEAEAHARTLGIPEQQLDWPA
jgi:hypothetical protein